MNRLPSLTSVHFLRKVTDVDHVDVNHKTWKSSCDFRRPFDSADSQLVTTTKYHTTLLHRLVALREEGPLENCMVVSTSFHCHL